jgi:hypothetical protein
LAIGDHSGRSVLVNVLAGESSPSGSFFKQNLENADKKLHNPRALALTGINEASGALLGPFSLGVTVAERFAKDKSAPPGPCQPHYSCQITIRLRFVSCSPRFRLASSRGGDQSLGTASMQGKFFPNLLP